MQQNTPRTDFWGNGLKMKKKKTTTKHSSLKVMPGPDSTYLTYSKSLILLTFKKFPAKYLLKCKIS